MLLRGHKGATGALYVEFAELKGTSTWRDDFRERAYYARAERTRDRVTMLSQVDCRLTRVVNSSFMCVVLLRVQFVCFLALSVPASRHKDMLVFLNVYFLLTKAWRTQLTSVSV